MDNGFEKLVATVGETVVAELWKKLQEGNWPLPPEYLDARAAAALLSISVKGLEDLRHRGEGPTYVRFGRSVRYKLSDLREWAERDRVVPGRPA